MTTIADVKSEGEVKESTIDGDIITIETYRYDAYNRSISDIQREVDSLTDRIVRDTEEKEALEALLPNE